MKGKVYLLLNTVDNSSQPLGEEVDDNTLDAQSQRVHGGVEVGARSPRMGQNQNLSKPNPNKENASQNEHFLADLLPDHFVHLGSFFNYVLPQQLSMLN